MGGVELPLIPMEIRAKEDLDEFHKVRKEYETYAIRLAEYEDTELTPEEIIVMKSKEIPFVPKAGEYYYYYNGMYDRESRLWWNNTDRDLMCLYFGNVFRTEDEITEQDKDRIKKIFDEIKGGKRYER
jgi:hypothetical protein